MPKVTAAAQRLHIVVIQSGWALIGEIKETPGALQISRASCIRSWGTTKGLGELALDGPQSQTKLDPMGLVTVPRHAVLFAIACEVKPWERYSL